MSFGAFIEESLQVQGRKKALHDVFKLGLTKMSFKGGDWLFSSLA
ncbi:unnamed protein product [Prunus brigantina]